MNIGHCQQRLASFQWTDGEGNARTTLLEEGVYEYDASFEDFVSLFDLQPDLRLTLAGFGGVPTLQEARRIAKSFDRIENTVEYSARSGKSEQMVGFRPRESFPWPFNKYRVDKEKLWGLWILKKKRINKRLYIFKNK